MDEILLLLRENADELEHAECDTAELPGAEDGELLDRAEYSQFLTHHESS